MLDGQAPIVLLILGWVLWISGIIMLSGVPGGAFLTMAPTTNVASQNAESNPIWIVFLGPASLMVILKDDASRRSS